MPRHSRVPGPPIPLVFVCLVLLFLGLLLFSPTQIPSTSELSFPAGAPDFSRGEECIDSPLIALFPEQGLPQRL